MAKKTRRQQYRVRPQAARPAAPQTPAAAPSRTAAAAAGAAVPAKSAADVAAEYQYVISDLKRIGITAASMFALLVVLALLLT
ncbi:MAG: hypothetical protein ACYC5O_05385 [Anaerolineae bacterium]